jgi:acetyl-CoA C-acetyltransferase
MPWLNKKIVICGGARIPIGHIACTLAPFQADELFKQAAEAAFSKTGVKKEVLDGVFVGWVGQSFETPNIARVSALKLGLPERVQSVTVHNNCVSSIEAVSAAVRAILTGEGRVYLAGGTESMSRMPFSLKGSRAAKELRSLEALKAKWAEIPTSTEVAVVDSIEQGLTDPVEKINMAATAEVCAQLHGIPREEQDKFAHTSFKRCIDGWNAGSFADHVVPFRSDGTALEKDEYPFLRQNLVAKPQMFGKAPTLFDNSVYPIKRFYEDCARHLPGKAYEEGKTRATVTLFNSCGRSDGASAIIVADEERAKELGLPIVAEILSWAYLGNNPAFMGLAPAHAAPLALERAGVRFEDLDQIELHEPFAATVLGIFKVGQEKFGYDWRGKFESGALNPNGGSIAMGHPLGATGTRLMLSLLSALKKNPKGRFGMIAACAGGGMGGSMVIERRA